LYKTAPCINIAWIISNRVISFAIGPYYLDKNAAPANDQDAGYWILDIGLTRYSVDFINRRRGTRGACTTRATPFSSIQRSFRFGNCNIGI
jgi:hypothetical protein